MDRRSGTANRPTRALHALVIVAVAGLVIAGGAALLGLSGGAAEPTATPSGSGAAFTADAETGDASQWCYVHSAVPVGVVSSPVRAGGHAFRSEIRDGELVYDTERSEYANGPGACNRAMFRHGDVTWTAVSVFLPDSFPRYSSWSLITQWKEPDGGSPPSQISIENERFAIIGAESVEPRPRFPLGDVVRGRWVDFLVHHRWSTDASVGFVEAFMNGERILPRTFTRTMENTNPLFLNVGHYRDLVNSGTAVLYIDEVRVGPTRESVEVSGLGTSP